MIEKLMKSEPKPVPRYEMEVLSSRTGNGTIPIALGVRDNKSGEIMDVHPLDTPALKEILPDAVYYRARTNTRGKITSITGLDENGKKIGPAVPVGKLIQTVAKERHTFADFDTFKNNPELSLVPLRTTRHFGRALHLDQGFALRDDNTGEVLRYFSEAEMRRTFASIDVAKVRVGKYGTVTSLDLKDGTRINEKDFIDELLGVKRPNRPHRRSKALTAASIGLAAAFVVTGVGDAQMPKITQAFNDAVAAKHYEVKIVKRNPGDDPISSFRAIQNPELKEAVENWFLDGTYTNLVDRLSEVGRARMESDDPEFIKKADDEAARLEKKMLWPVEVARAVDTMWTQDSESLKNMGFDSPVEVLQYALTTTKIESVFGEQLTNAENPTVAGYYHFNDTTFISARKNYEKTFGHITIPAADGKAPTREDLLAQRNDPYISTLMFLQYTKDMQLGKNSTPVTFYRKHVLGPGGYNKLAAHPNMIAATLLPAAAADNPSLFDNKKTGRQTLHALDARFIKAADAVRQYGFEIPDGGKPILFAAVDDFKEPKAVKKAAKSPVVVASNEPPVRDHFESASILNRPTSVSASAMMAAAATETPTAQVSLHLQ